MTEQLRRDMDAIKRRVWAAHEQGRALFFVTRREWHEVLLHPALRPTDREVGQRKFMCLDVEVVDYELPYDARMAVTGPPEWMRRIQQGEGR